ncbi:MAG: hypothetical protein HRU21_09295 [Pseudomonadales bacterium]|nr:hypothetical protein [Pseudomonadales bacterium]
MEIENPELKTERSLDEYISSISDTYIDIGSLCDARYGSFVEIAYEWSWEQARNMLEILEVKKELERRDNIKQHAQTL